MNVSEGLSFMRLMMVLSSMGPLFLLVAIRGVGAGVMSDQRLWILCLSMCIVPTLILGLRMAVSKKISDTMRVVVNTATDHREYLVAYLFAMLMPLYQANFDNLRNALADIVAILFVVFVFYYMNLHYMNILFALSGYRVYTADVKDRSEPLVILSKRHFIEPGATVQTYRISNTVLIEL